jgi:hypothetical protein
MINSELPAEPTAGEDRVDRIVAEGPHGALTVAGIASAIVVALWLAFYLFVFLPRGALQ